MSEGTSAKVPTPIVKPSYSLAPTGTPLAPTRTVGPEGPGRPYTGGTILDAMKSARPVLPEPITTRAIADRLAELIWTFDGRPYREMWFQASCADDAAGCDLTMTGLPDFVASIDSSDSYFWSITTSNGAITSSDRALRGYPPTLGKELDALARSGDADGRLEGVPLTGAEWRPAAGLFELRYGGGNEECDPILLLTVDLPGRRLVSSEVTNTCPSPSASLASATAPFADARVDTIGRSTYALVGEWAPGGKRLAVLEVEGWRGEARFFDVGSDGSAKAVGEIAGTELAWIDDSQFLVLGEDARGVYLGRVGAPSVSRVPGAFGKGMVGNGHGAVAIPSPDGNTYVIWSDGHLSAAHPGSPLEWSPDGDKLLVVHADEQFIGWPELVDIGGARVAAFSSTTIYVAMTPVVAFSPDGTRIALAALNGALVLDPASGTALRIPAEQPVASVAWSGADRLLVALEGGSVEVWSAAGTKVRAVTARADRLATSVTGVTALLRAEQGEIEFSGSAAAPVRLPERICETVTWSPGGSALLVVCSPGDSSWTWSEALLIRP